MDILGRFAKRAMDAWDGADSERLARVKARILPDDIKIIQSVPYLGDDLPGHTLDVYAPKTHTGGLPVFIDIHGGGFIGGTKEMDKLFCYELAKRGFLVFTPNYRRAYSQTTIKGQIDDIAAATAWISHKLSEYGGNPDQVYLCGHSAGAVLALTEALLSLSPRLQQVFDRDLRVSLCYQGLVLDSGYLMFTDHRPSNIMLRDICFERGYRSKEYYRTMKWAQVPELDLLPPVYLMSNNNDKLKKMTLDFEALLQSRQIAHRLNFQDTDGLGHMGIIYEADTPEGSAILDDMCDYLLHNRTQEE